MLAAEAFGADRTWFVVNGCSSAIHAAVMSCAGPGDTLLVARNCHLSVFSAMVMSGGDRYHTLLPCTSLEQRIFDSLSEPLSYGHNVLWALLRMSTSLARARVRCPIWDRTLHPARDSPTCLRICPSFRDAGEGGHDSIPYLLWRRGPYSR